MESSSSSSTSRSIATPSALLRSDRGKSQSKCRNRSRSRSCRKILVDDHHVPSSELQKPRCDRSPSRPRRGHSPAQSRVLASSCAPPLQRQLETAPSSSTSQRRLECSSPERNRINSNTAAATPSKSAKLRTPAGSKTIRRPLTPEELEMAFQANPSLREAIANSQTGRLGKVKLRTTTESSTVGSHCPSHGSSGRIVASDDNVNVTKSSSTTKSTTKASNSGTINHDASVTIRSRKLTSTTQRSTRSLSKKGDISSDLLKKDDVGQSSKMVRSPTKTRRNNHNKLDEMMRIYNKGGMMSPTPRSVSHSSALLSPKSPMAKNLPPLLVGLELNDLDSSPDFTTHRLSSKPQPPPEGIPSPRHRTTLSSAQKTWSSARTLNTPTMIPTMKPLDGGIRNNNYIRPTVFSKQDVPSFGKKLTNLSISNPAFQSSDNSNNVASTKSAKRNATVMSNDKNARHQSQRVLLGHSINDTLIQKELAHCFEVPPRPPQRQKSLDDIMWCPVRV